MLSVHSNFDLYSQTLHLIIHSALTMVNNITPSYYTKTSPQLLLSAIEQGGHSRWTVGEEDSWKV